MGMVRFGRFIHWTYPKIWFIGPLGWSKTLNGSNGLNPKNVGNIESIKTTSVVSSSRTSTPPPWRSSSASAPSCPHVLILLGAMVTLRCQVSSASPQEGWGRKGKGREKRKKSWSLTCWNHVGLVHHVSENQTLYYPGTSIISVLYVKGCVIYVIAV